MMIEASAAGKGWFVQKADCVSVFSFIFSLILNVRMRTVERRERGEGMCAGLKYLFSYFHIFIDQHALMKAIEPRSLLLNDRLLLA